MKKFAGTFDTCIHGGRQFVRHEVDWPKRFHIRALPFQKGDAVRTPKGFGIVDAVGLSGLRGIHYRVRNHYWFAFQLKHATPAKLRQFKLTLAHRKG
jgi:hypothetical protein